MDVIADILKLLSDGKPQKITHISQKLNINPAVTTEYIGFLQKQKLIEKILISTKRQEFRVTEEGNKLREKIEVFQHQIAMPELETIRRNKKFES